MTSTTRHPDGNPSKSSFGQKFIRARRLITIEPLIALYQMALHLCKPALDNLELEKTCKVNLQYNTTICGNILKGNHENFTLQNREIHVIISGMHSWQQPIQSFVPLVLALFLGSFSDKYRWRKPFFLIPIVGEILGNIGSVLCVVYMDSWPVQVQGILQKVVPSLFGGQTMISMATTAYIADVSSVDTRTFRLGIVQLVLSITLPLTNSFCGILFLKIGYFGMLSISILFLITAIIYGFFCVKEENRYCKEKKEKERPMILIDMFNIHCVVKTFKLLFENNPDTQRTFLWLVIAAAFCYRGAFDGETSVIYLYTQNVFKWTPVDFSYFLTVNGFVLLVGNIAFLPLFTKVLNMSDLLILIVTLITKILTNLTFGLARSPLIFYLGVIISLITRMFKVAKKSMATKIVAINDVGKTQSLLSIFEAAAPAISVPIFNLVYISTISTYPSMFFYLGIAIYGLCLILTMIMHCKIQRKKFVLKENKENIIIDSLHM